MKELVKKLVVLELQEKGIDKQIYGRLSSAEKDMVVEKNGKYHVKAEERKKVTVVFTGGVFDIIHIGHVYTLNEAKRYGDVLVVGIARDEHIRKKNREPIHTQEYRRELVEALKSVDVAISGFHNPEEMIELVKPDVIVYGYDQPEFLKPDGVRIVKLEQRVDETKFKTRKILDSLGV